ncbi:DinB family protein [Skermania sp. ID1734]|uniref:mycothiol transferase n=1 Tax=Skermania sp. ID1734 TaxID=2597516 RepID=UPI0011801BA4|nr:DinB family protein [Skermania sp. ID1734]TSE01016.1 DinB family protein [Skermania sp. ID1734]
MDHVAVLTDAFGRVRDEVHAVLDGLPEAALTYRIDGDANTIAWLVWHLTRVQDDHVCDVAGRQQAWTEGGWSERFALPFSAEAIGYGQSSQEVAQVRADADLLRGYYDAVHDRTLDYLRTVTAEDLDRVVDRRWDPPVTLGVRLVSVISDDLQHVGQAAFVRGVFERQ